MRKIIMDLIKTILVELGLIITIVIQSSLAAALYYDMHPVLCSLIIIIDIITIILTIWYTDLMVLSFRIFILGLKIYKDELIIRKLLRQYEEEANLIKKLEDNK